MFGSKNNFFHQDLDVLISLKMDMIHLLQIKGRSTEDINEYVQAYHFFVKNPSRFDGATIVKDLVDVRSSGEYLDLDAMLHDYEYIVGANLSFIKKWKSDWKYIKNMEKNGKGIRVPRLIILTVSGIVFVPYKIITEKI